MFLGEIIVDYSKNLESSALRPTRNLEDQASVFMSPSDRLVQLYYQALGSLFVAFYDSQGYGGGILTRLHTWDSKKHMQHTNTLSGLSSASCLRFTGCLVHFATQKLQSVYLFETSAAVHWTTWRMSHHLTLFNSKLIHWII
jgi:hypothetical protein